MFEIIAAKNGENTLKLNDRFVYSKYTPKKDATTFVTKHCDQTKECYLLIGLGLGYHLDSLIEIVGQKEIYVLVCDEQELTICPSLKRYQKAKHIHLISFEQLATLEFNDELQVIIPYSILNSLSFNHPVRETFEQFKLNEMSFMQYNQKLADNFEKNLTLQDDTVKSFHNKLNVPAILVSSGPSIDLVIEQIKRLKGKVFILAVGSALRILKRHDIEPDAIVWADAKEVGIWHMHKLEYTGPMFYLATSSHEVINQYKGPRYMMFQKGYAQSEQLATELDVDAFEVGGSVATAGFSLLKYMGVKEIILCGQDLGFKEGKTHSKSTFSGVSINENFLYRQIPANDGSFVKVSKSLYSYFKWFNHQIPLANIKVYNTAKHGAKIKGAVYLDATQLYAKYAYLMKKDFSTLFEVE